MYGNPFADPLEGDGEITTASSKCLGAGGGQPSISERGHAAMSTSVADGSVEHGPLYFEDPLLTGGSNDGRFAWTWEDYVGILYGDGRFLLNTCGLAVSAVVYPPWTAVRSAGFDLTSHEAESRDRDDTRLHNRHPSQVRGSALPSVRTSS